MMETEQENLTPEQKEVVDKHFENVEFMMDKFIEYSNKFASLDFKEGAMLPRGLVIPVQDYVALVMEFTALGAEMFVNTRKESNGDGLANFLMELGTVREVMLRSLDASLKEADKEDD